MLIPFDGIILRFRNLFIIIRFKTTKFIINVWSKKSEKKTFILNQIFINFDSLIIKEKFKFYSEKNFDKIKKLLF